MSEERFKKCANCDNFIPEPAMVCMYCNAQQPGFKRGRKEQKSTGTLKKFGVGAIAIFFLCIVLTIIGNLFSGDKTATSTQSGQQVAAVSAPTFTPTSSPPTDTPIPADTPTPEPTSTPISLTGAGQQASPVLNLEAGLILFDMTHNGQRNFAVTLLDSSGSLVDLLVNEIGPFNGGKAAQVRSAGQYLLNIDADGNWNVVVQQPQAIQWQSVPTTLSGSGQTYSPFVWLDEGLHRFTLNHSGGQGNFAVILLNQDGGLVDLLANEIGSFDGSKAVGIRQSGPYLLDISADGNWTIAIE